MTYTQKKILGIFIQEQRKTGYNTLVSNKKDIKAGDIIIQQGDHGTNAYIIESGLVEILIEKENNLIQKLGTRGEGSIIGEMALVDNKPRTATIKAVEDCVLLEITETDFERRLENSDPVIQMVTKIILARYRDMITRAHILGTSKKVPTPEEMEKGLIEKTNAVENIKISNDLKLAIKNNSLELHYQPIVDIKTQKIKGLEALIRWQHPEKGFIPPDIFIPIAEDNGLIVDISRWVTLQACSTLQEIKEIFENIDLFASINFSATDFEEPDFQSYIDTVLKKTNLSPQDIHLEITERLLMSHPGKARKTLDACRQDGMVISIDDFGTGYSSLSYLHYFPIDILKIDRSFVNDMTNDKGALELIKSITSLGHNLNMKVIAEGVETKEQSEVLKEIGCDNGQGYFFAKPMTKEDLINYIKA